MWMSNIESGSACVRECVMFVEQECMCMCVCACVRIREIETTESNVVKPTHV